MSASEENRFENQNDNLRHKCDYCGRFRAREDIYLPDRCCCCISGFFERNKLYLTCALEYDQSKKQQQQQQHDFDGVLYKNEEWLYYCNRDLRSPCYSASEFCIRPRRERSLSDLLYTAYNVHMCSRAFTCRYYKLDKVARALFFGGIAAAAYLAWLVAAAAVE
ncbi:unnamed protein product [Trichogramma brassicae]|uniref:Uncharacterized protein n=1 Tax=Trichogramma brassicae TaxID=86971 RepID=A0A6H5HZ72_9HYME|nr:unnamed protein product [Trichogramma brassicae]CAB0030563.1 unnamed protein product [Trichogramma brassicae]CAB0030565.1 unnamed protein product [Trichogramma brassicae]